MSESTDRQRDRVLALLRECGAASTLYVRRALDILHPAARVQELREEGHSIRTVWTTDAMPNGKPHRVALYLLAAQNGIGR